MIFDKIMLKVMTALARALNTVSVFSTLSICPLRMNPAPVPVRSKLTPNEISVRSKLTRNDVSGRCTLALGLIVAMLSTTASFSMPANAELLQGNVSESGQAPAARLQRPVQGSVQDGPPAAPPIRLSRAQAEQGQPPQQPLQGLVDTSSFGPVLTGHAQQGGMRLGIAKPDEFQLPRGFDLGAERGSKELMLAWEQWHRQFSKAIYDRWSSIADEPGRATVKIMVTRDRQISIQFVSSNGSRHFDGELASVIMGLNGNPGLTFPTKSLRQQVSFEADYIAAHDVMPGYSWVKNDYEKVRQTY